jgi:hypothetical protein
MYMPKRGISMRVQRARSASFPTGGKVIMTRFAAVEMIGVNENAASLRLRFLQCDVVMVVARFQYIN